MPGADSAVRLAGVDGESAWALSDTELSVSDDGGEQWSYVALPADVTPQAVVSIAEAPDGELWLATVQSSDVTLYRKSSTSTWSDTSLVPSWSTATAGFSFQTGSVEITPGPSDMVTVVLLDELGHTTAIPRLFVSLDDGATFRQYPTPMTSALNIYWQSVTFVSSASGVLVATFGAGAGETLFYTPDGGASWRPATVAGLRTNVGIVFGTPFVVGPDLELPAIRPTEGGGETLSLYVSQDGGASFTGPIGSVITTTGTFALSPSVVADYGESLWVLGGGKIYESADNGQRWATVTTSGLERASAMSLTGTSAATAVTGKGSCAGFKSECTYKTWFVRTTDGGQTWSQAPAISYANCLTTQLILVAGSYGEAAGMYSQTFTFANQSDEPCQLGGWPAFAVVGNSGEFVPTKTERVRQNASSDPAWATVILAPGAAASFDVYNADWDAVDNRACPDTSAVSITPPNNASALSVRVQIPDCELTFKISPLIAGTTDRQAWSEVVG